MSNNIFKNTIISLSLFFPIMAFSQDKPQDNTVETKQSTTQTKQVKEMPKEDWLSKVKEVVPVPICKGFLNDESIAKRFKDMDVTYETCLKEIPLLTDACIKKYNSKLPDMITEESASKWGRLIGECIGASFAEKHLYKEDEKEDTAKEKKKTDAEN